MIEKKDFIPYGGKKAKFIAIGVKDSFKQTLESFELERGKDIDNFRKIKAIKEKYEFDLNPNKRKKEKEKNWIKKDMKW